MQAGAVAFLDKPFSIDNVKAWAADLIQRSESAICTTRA
jgi:DNA-binding response OmpR family regulator